MFGWPRDDPAIAAVLPAPLLEKDSEHRHKGRRKISLRFNRPLKIWLH
jgi:hypothetical protein